MFNHICHTYFIFVLFICFLNQLLKKLFIGNFVFQWWKKVTLFFKKPQNLICTHTPFLFIYLFR